jgi:hypothetical protein
MAEFTEAFKKISCENLAKNLEEKGDYHTLEELGSTDAEVRSTLEGKWRDGDKEVPYGTPGEVGRALQYWKNWKAQQNGVPKDAKPDDCELSKALLNLSPNLREIAVILVNRKGYYTFASLGGSDDAVRVKVTEAVGTGYAKPGDIGQVVAAWKAAQKKTGTILDLPESALADQKLDLTAPQITIRDVKWEIPNHFPVAKGADKFKAAGELTKLEWLPIAKRTGLLYALDIASALREKSKGQAAPILAQKPAFYWKVNDPAASDFSRPLDWDGDTLEELSYTESACSLVHSKMTAGALNIATPFCAASLEASREEKNAKSAKSKNLHLSGTSRIIYAKLDLNKCLALREEVIKEIDNALTKPTIAEKAKALQAVFDDYGYLVPKTVELGGAQYMTSNRVEKASETEQVVKDSIAAAVKAQYGTVKAGGKFKKTEGESLSTAAQEILSIAKTFCSGGEGYLKGTDQWPQSTRDPNKWAIIGRGDLVPLTDYLLEPRKTSVERVWNEWLESFWGGHTAPKGYFKPVLDGLPFTISNGTGPQAVGLRPVYDPPGQPAALAPNSELGNPMKYGLAWELRYAEDVTDEGGPVYFIIERLIPDQAQGRAEEWEAKKAARLAALGGRHVQPLQEPLKRATLAAKEVAGEWRVCCEEAPDPGKPEKDLGNNYAAWRLEPATPLGVGYVIRNHVKTDLTLGTLGGTAPQQYVKLEATTPGPVWYCKTVAPK